MAISINRLEELIKQGATIYTIKHIGGDVMELHLKNISDDFRYFLLDMTEELFEDKAEVEEKAKKIKWALKYHATRTEELNLPMWNEFITYNENIGVSFVGEDWVVYELSNDIDIYHKPRILLTADGEYFEEWKSTEENYEKACDLCLKLFKGEQE